MSETSAGGNPPRTVRVWDPVVRLFHWTVVIAVVLNLFVLKPGRLYHRYAGYVVIGAVLIRLVWGFVGTRHARFADFFPTPRRLACYLKALFRGQEPRFLGHNPAAAVMMLALMVLLLAVGATGWMMTLDAFWGEEWLEELHEGFANAIMVLALVHAAAAIVESLRHRENLVWSMVTGRKRA
ncbi:cytochrome b/b6 domain-containing protein [Pleomorphomonas sp. NRK KF1]|uniref:cytochrome b/b6 domain-containing protein n=1 Tax=Pleomorphomonas sp. NRK KF1 TaxID=2943000 RepID=UPI0020430C8E|nr:cytochrome b/b6 domain-containing protein [Pleomorphomonas sp. NRK KF1]MCM5554491.1 cytochrome b/b6 domain-containing protein [Pleomorphomonas sp. NRK KF1]